MKPPLATAKAHRNRPLSSLIPLFTTQLCSNSNNNKPVALLETRRLDGTVSFQEALCRFGSTLQTQPIPSISVFNHLLASVLRANHNSLVVSLYRQSVLLGSLDFRPDLATLSTVIKSMCRLKEVGLAFSVLGTAFKRGFEVDAWTLNSLLHGLCGAGFLVLARELFEEMSSQKLPRNRVTYVIMINGFCKAGEIHMGIDILKRMFEGGVIKPFAACYAPIIDSAWKRGRMDDALSLFRHMIDCDIGPDLFVCNSLINGFCKSAHWEEAMTIVGIMARTKITPNVYTLNTLLVSLCKEERSKTVLGFMEAMRNVGLKPDVVTYSLLISGHCHSGRWREAVALLDEIKSEGVSPCVVTFTIVIDALIKLGRAKEALSVFYAMIERDISPSIVTYNVVLYGLCHADQWVEASRLLDEMASLGILPDPFTLTGILDAMAEKGMMYKAQKLFQRMVQHGPRPNLITFNTMVKGYCRLGEMDMATGVFEQMESMRYRPCIITYNTLALGYMKVDKVYLALKLLEDVIRRGLVPNDVTRHILKSIHARRIISFAR